MQKYETDLFSKIYKVLLPKDYLRLWLTGEYISDPSDSAGTSWLNTRTRDWSDRLLDRTNLDRSYMPDLVEGSELGGNCDPKLPRIGVLDLPFPWQVVAVTMPRLALV